MLSSQENTQLSEVETKLFKRRWVFLVAQCSLQALSGLSFSCFGEISNFYVEYFDVSYWEVDWLTLTHDIPAFVITVPLAILTLYEFVQLRNLTLISTCCATVGFGCFTASLTNRSMVLVMILGQFFVGTAAQIMQAIPPIFAALWFPENEVGTAIASQIMGMYIGCAMGALLPVTVIQKDSDIQGKKETLLILYAVLFVLAVLVSIFLAIFMTDVPPLPPTLAQSFKRENNCSVEAQLVPGKCTKFRQATKAIFTNKTFVLTSFILGIAYQVNTIMFILMSQILRPLSDTLPRELTVDQSAGYLIVALTGGGAFFSILGGLIINKFKNFKLIAIVGNIFTIVFMVVSLLSWVYPSYPLLFAGILFTGASQKFVTIPSYEILMQTTFPMDETFVGVWMSGLQTPLGIVYGVVGRAVFNQWGALGVLIVPPLNVLVGLCMCFALSSDRKRLDFANVMPDNNNVSEETNLIR